ncbi:maestro heat-like repeat family member 5 [Pteropus medius]|uniref:maestro heat-like repeat family member 5 n=1 Tax=Pteropus vampyrus TaxID=132908 RepID=UPI00196B605D|nr:maestro heat-like repeat family member 5 [Pteropus giganteus]
MPRDRAAPLGTRTELAAGACGFSRPHPDMDRQHAEKPHSHTTAERASSGLSQNPRISFHISEPTRDLSYRKAPQGSASGDRPVHSATILLSNSQSSQAALVPQEHKMFLEEAYNAAICFKMLRELNSSDTLRLKHIVSKIRDMAHRAPNLVLETIYDYFIDNLEVGAARAIQLLHVLETVIGAMDSLEETWKEAFMKLALENMTKSTELEEAYQDAAGNVLVAICRHSWQPVAQQLETEVLTGVFPHRSLLYVMGVLTSNQQLLSQGEKACWEEKLTQIAVKSVPFLNTDVWSKELLWALTTPDRTQQEQPPEKAFLFVYYGLILQAEDNGNTVRTHLRTLLETSHQWPKQREGMALTTGLAAARHLDHVWAVLEQFGHSAPIKWSLHTFSPKTSDDLRWKWASSTILLAYGQMAVKAKAHILPWVDNILSRMIFYFRYSSWDETLKQSFLAAILMLVGAISRNEGAHSYEFSQLPELLECLMVLMEKEPQDTLCTLTRQRTLCIISSLCKLRPPLDLEKKSRLLTICLRSVLALPLPDVLEKHTCLFLEPPNVQTLYNKTSEALDHMLQSLLTQDPTTDELRLLLSHLYVWLVSEKAHERQRAVRSCAALLRFLNDNLYLHPNNDFRWMGQLMGMLGILCQDPDVATQRSSLEGLGHLYCLLLRQRAEASKAKTLAPEQLSQASEDEAPLWSSGDQKATPPASQEVVFQKDQIFQLGSSQVIKEIMKHLSLEELTDLVWTTVNSLGSTGPCHGQAAADMLLTIIQEHGAKLETASDASTSVNGQSQARGREGRLRALVPEAAMNTLHELQFAREFKEAVQEAYPQLLLALLTQILYILELNLPEGPRVGQEAQGAATPSPQSTSLEALKSLVSTTGHWQDFAHLELRGSWDLFTTIHTYPQGVGLLARAMVHNRCRQIEAVTRQLLPALQSQEVRARKVAMLILNEFLYSPALLGVLPEQAALTVLARSLRDCSPEVRVLGLQGLGNILFHPEKGSLLCRQLPPFLDGFFRSSEPVVVRLMGTVSDTLHRLGVHSVGAQSLSIAINSRSFFEDERDGIRAAAMALFGDLVAAMAGREPRSLKTQVQQSMVPLLLHLKDRCPAVVTQAKFAYYRCAELLGWRLRHTLFSSLAWERGLSARHFLWACLMSSSQEEFSIHFAQALSCLHSCQHHIKTWAALFIGYTLCYHPRAASQTLNDSDTKLLLRTFEDLRKGPEPGMPEFAARQLSFLQEVVADRSGLPPSPLTCHLPNSSPGPTACSAPPRLHRARLHNIFPFERKI